MADSETIGIMADSHGDADTLAAAIRFFTARGCRRMVHLGDICDSVTCERSEACVRLIRENRVLAVKGNNDHAVANSRILQENGCISAGTAAFLEGLPLQVEMARALFVHSRPFSDVLGLSAMTGDIEPADAARFLDRCPGRVLFRGHGHTPRAIRLTETRRTTLQPAPGDRLQLEEGKAWIVTCGALFNGLCMIWAPATGIVTSHRLTS